MFADHGKRRIVYVAAKGELIVLLQFGDDTVHARGIDEDYAQSAGRAERVPPSHLPV